MIQNMLVFIPGFLRGFKPVFDKYYIINKIPFIYYMLVSSPIFMIVIIISFLLAKKFKIKYFNLENVHWDLNIIFKIILVSILLPLSSILYLYLLSKYQSYLLVTLTIIVQIITMLIFNIYLGKEKIDIYVLTGIFLIIIGVLVLFAPKLVKKK